MNNKAFITELARRTGYTHDDTRRMINSAVAAMTTAFQNDNTLVVPRFGLFEVKKRMERILVNPSTKQRMLVPPKLVLNFKPYAATKAVGRREANDGAAVNGTDGTDGEAVNGIASEVVNGIAGEAMASGADEAMKGVGDEQ